MKRKNIIFVTLLGLLSLFAIQSCNKADDTTFKTETTYAVPTAQAPIAEADGTIVVADTTLNLEWATANAVSGQTWNVYFGQTKQPALLQSGVADTKYTVHVSDGAKYYWRVETTDANGVVTSSPVFNFIPITGENPKFTVELKVTTPNRTALGVTITPDEFADIRMRIMKENMTTVAVSVNNAGASKSDEIYRLFAGLADGVYYIATELYGTINAGNYNVPIDIDLSLSFTQQGLINTTYEYPKVMNNLWVCSSYRIFLAKVTKTGSKYEVERFVKSWH